MLIEKNLLICLPTFNFFSIDSFVLKKQSEKVEESRKLFVNNESRSLIFFPRSIVVELHVEQEFFAKKPAAVAQFFQPKFCRSLIFNNRKKPTYRVLLQGLSRSPFSLQKQPNLKIAQLKLNLNLKLHLLRFFAFIVVFSSLIYSCFSDLPFDPNLWAVR